MSELLLLLEASLCIGGIAYIFPREKIFAVFFFFLFLYAIVPQLGYFYISDLSVQIKAYFGEGPWYPASILITTSFVLILILFSLFWRPLVALMPLRFSIKKLNTYIWQNVSLGFVVALVIFQGAYLFLNFDNVNWYANQDEDLRSTNQLFSIFLMSFKYSVAVNVVLYCIAKDDLGNYPNIVYKTLSIISLSMFILIAMRLGNRTDFLALGLGIFVYHLYRDKLNFRWIYTVITCAVILGIALYMIEVNRYSDEGSNQDSILEKLMLKDYYAPAHMLFAAVYYELIDPMEVFVSNVSNSLMMLNYPYLQFGITEEFNPGVATRSAGYAFYLLTEGFMVAGMFGFIYNAFVIILGMAAWKKFACTRYIAFNNFLLGLMGCMLVNLVRGQSSYFIKYFYTFILPGAFLYVLLAGYSLGLSLDLRGRRVE